MTFEQLADFLGHRMRMSHVYQPVMLMTLLEHSGESTERDIAQAILRHDESQAEYYQKITRDMVGRVLRNHGIVRREAQTYRLEGYDALSAEQVDTLVALCQQKLDAYVAQRASADLEPPETIRRIHQWHPALRRAQTCQVPV